MNGYFKCLDCNFPSVDLDKFKTFGSERLSCPECSSENIKDFDFDEHEFLDREVD